jgi:2-polyprenyl-6-methoxyphenol hydroxylase-like FAD-dependent oxidoreductase
MTDVLVVGAGPVGLVAACELARRGIAIRVIDKLPEATDESRAIVVHARSLEMFERVGVVDDIIAAGVKTTAMQMFAGGHRIARVELENVDSAYPYSVTIAQTETERVLTERLRALGGSIERGVELVGLTQDDASATATLSAADGSREHLEVPWVVGSDGARSTVRHLVGTQLEGSFKGERFVLGDVEAQHSLETNSMYTYFAADGPVMLFPMRGSRMRVIAQVHDGAQPLDLHPSQDYLQQLVSDRGADIRITASHWLTEFEIHHAQVPAYRAGRAFLAGDAAHVHSPAGGQGMNTGMQDAFNLGWKLADTVHGRGGDRLLDSYQDERHPIAAKVIDFTTRLTTLATVHGEIAIKLRNLALHLATGLAPVRRALSEQAEETGIAYRHSPIVGPRHWRSGVAPGDHAPLLPDGAAGDLTTDASGHIVLSLDADAAAAYGITAPAHVAIRPDGYVGAIEPDPDGITAYFAQLLGQS